MGGIPDDIRRGTINRGISGRDVAAPVKRPRPETQFSAQSNTKDQTKLIAELQRASRRELNELQPDCGILASIDAHRKAGGIRYNGPLVRRYYDLLEALKAWAELPASGFVFTDANLKEWASVVNETSHQRWIVARQLVKHYEGMLEDGQKYLRTQGDKFQGLRNVFEKFRQKIERNKHFIHDLDSCVTILEALSAIQKCATAQKGISTKGLLSSLGLVATKSLILESELTQISDAWIGMQMQAEGYLSMNELRQKIQALEIVIKMKFQEMQVWVRAKEQAEYLSKAFSGDIAR